MGFLSNKTRSHLDTASHHRPSREETTQGGRGKGLLFPLSTCAPHAPPQNPTSRKQSGNWRVWPRSDEGIPGTCPQQVTAVAQGPFWNASKYFTAKKVTMAPLFPGLPLPVDQPGGGLTGRQRADWHSRHWGTGAPDKKLRILGAVGLDLKASD